MHAERAAPTPLQTLLRLHAGDAPEYGIGLASHLPMALAALDAMGASADRLRVFAARYRRSHELVPMDATMLAARERWSVRLEREGRAALLAAELPRLVAHVGAAAFHAAIRLAYATCSDEASELAAALAYWDAARFRIDAPSEPRRTDVRDALARLAAVALRVEPRGLISTRMATVAADPRFRALAELVPPTDALDDLARAAAAAFARGGDFVALHVMTGTFALRVLAPMFGEGLELAMGPFWRAYASAAIVSGAIPALDTLELNDLAAIAPTSWEPLLAAAVASDDDHVVKATYTAWMLERALGDRIFRTAAARYLARRG